MKLLRLQNICTSLSLGISFTPHGLHSDWLVWLLPFTCMHCRTSSGWARIQGLRGQNDIIIHKKLIIHDMHDNVFHETRFILRIKITALQRFYWKVILSMRKHINAKINKCRYTLSYSNRYKWRLGGIFSSMHGPISKRCEILIKTLDDLMFNDAVINLVLWS